MRTFTVDYNGERFEVSGLYTPKTTNRDTGERFFEDFEASSILWVNMEINGNAILIDVMPIMTDDQVSDIEQIVLKQIQNEDD
jgi:hypothetical protein